MKYYVQRWAQGRIRGGLTPRSGRTRWLDCGIEDPNLAFNFLGRDQFGQTLPWKFFARPPLLRLLMFIAAKDKQNERKAIRRRKSNTYSGAYGFVKQNRKTHTFFFVFASAFCVFEFFTINNMSARLITHDNVNKPAISRSSTNSHIKFEIENRSMGMVVVLLPVWAYSKFVYIFLLACDRNQTWFTPNNFSASTHTHTANATCKYIAQTQAPSANVLRNF